MAALPAPPGAYEAQSTRRLAALALTMGDPAGIGPEIALKAWAARETKNIAPFAFYGDVSLLEERARLLGLPVTLQPIDMPEAAPSIFAKALPIIAVPLAHPSRPGEPDSANAAATLQAIELAVAHVALGRARAVVTCPIAKSVLYAAGFKHPGHTEFLAHLAAKHWPGRDWPPVMMLACDRLRVVPLTIHIPLKDVPRLVTRDALLATVRTVHAALKTQFAIAAPRIAIAGLNPHAGEDGAIGREEIDTLAPAIAALRREGLIVTGPYSADTLFHEAARATYDAVVCMYHDQALIPIKTLAFDEGVNVTLGLPFLRTSPDHGTAFAIAAKGIANPSSLIHALKLADTLTQRTTPHTATTS
ncbi:MAG: 4-hydroxythreonine-4-phosphate dehydrogenase PdxA [Hyphomicrobium sp.]